MKKICFVTGSRAEYGIMRRLLGLLQEDSEIELSLVVTAMHLEEKYGMTVGDIEADKRRIVKRIPLNLADTSKKIIARSLATLTEKLTDLFEEVHYDLVMILGDRYEMLPVANVALLYNIPICHIHGGEKTLGNFDESIRHAITKMSHLHLTSTEEFRNRVIQLGENPEYVYNIGAMGVENVLKQEFLTRDELAEELGVQLAEEYYVVLFHPVTLENDVAEEQTLALLTALAEDGKQCLIIGSNSDTHADRIMKRMYEFVTEHPTSHIFSSLPTRYYHSLVKYSNGLIGNSSSGLIEVPSLQVPTLNIGNRQLGRLSGPSVVHVGTSKEEVGMGLKQIKAVTDFTNPFEQPDSAQQAYQAIKAFLAIESSTMKEFHDR
ncbi:UDP-N-acetylglucosamine 2-epimerase [Streptococcus suis]|uniref:CPS16T n=2 Tax=Streptococcus suis TaxID=1307 RepID=E9NQ27_STRSU|nr:UDP-N-acetylglucosamine 2-epimerase [Streptococcus suis]ADU03254.1 CPS16T [Streptococcus suis]AGL48114.1 UDP-N-acetylglucosamine 2-epimerase [Streptococcus suis TL13]MBL6515801.1 UDP-N-acetylglucosamine 2-epimerase (hydrolyzing) [Streptococcus suis]MBY4959932.1 UDP-N-acetylglucosamine 2-epimerase (hydrolyzing) [Streptococcus suis]MBY5027364.1 UDP-N-acetylglucosamine 2-epimerase (hydrolyzing) [Streptococcus suis]